MTDKAPPTPPRRRQRWGRWTLIGVCAVGAVVVILIATTHPWWSTSSPAPEFTMKTLAISFTGTGASAVKATAVCGGRCPFPIPAGSHTTVTFTITPNSQPTGCDWSTYYRVTKVVETTSGAFALTGVTADNPPVALPVPIPYPYNGSTCISYAQIWLAFSVVDSGASTQTPALTVTVAKV
ncbi:MAG TPA: hypothetical protein VML53_05335 [Thermoplasmata archaeon]|nr:hypothetical protein [Thermoplasmata archaeon]